MWQTSRITSLKVRISDVCILDRNSLVDVEAEKFSEILISKFRPAT